MNRVKKHFSFLILVLLSISCSAHKQPVNTQHIPPPQPGLQAQGSDLYHPPVEVSDQRKIIVQHAIKSLGLPYKWGGRSPKTGFDCSGLIVYTHQKADILIPRTAKAQFDNGKVVSLQNLQVADLVFFKDTKSNKVFHVGIFIGDNIFVHAPGQGRLVSYGYLNNSYFKKHYIGSRSYL
ncbi:MAG: C40 family peptidase [Proteobacteria bacterium]|nr:C40 family peptidase [Pseudomonadota bacterium]MBU1584963.1 C40 family peptidase [Pseudomonadota bacterium]MBU2455241.1 C40 family peptidase [Pseudomonadota bacterium]MBU2628934.1 C40 family peptidase [Pseudomonadota bacterium]